MRYITVLKTIFNVQKNGVDNEQRILLTDAGSSKIGLVGQPHDTELHDRNRKTGVRLRIISCLSRMLFHLKQNSCAVTEIRLPIRSTNFKI